ncbi:MAG TPA: hypothetical protein VF116_10850 [Ktedonobacterales bacterium]
MSRLGTCQMAHGRRAALALGCLLVIGLLAGCSGSGNQLTPGLAGATQDHPAAPPKIAATGPGGAFAFVYDNQIWLRDAQGGAKQLTHLVLSNGATLVWGPLVWSPDGKYIAFALVQNLTPASPTRSTGPLYYVDVSSGNAYTTPGTGSVYGHTYVWFATDRALIYSSTSDLMLYDLGDADPRVWSLRTAVANSNSDGATFSSGGNSYGDIALSGDGNTLYYTVLNVTNLGGTGIIGSAEVRSISLYQLNSDLSSTPPDVPSLPTTIALDVQQMQNNRSSQPVAPLGSVYSDAAGVPTAGAWQLSSGNNGDNYVAAQQIDGVDTGKGIVASHFCRIEVGYTYCNGLFANVGKFPIATHAALALSPNDRVAVTTDALYTQGAYGGAVAKVTAASGWGVAPSWSGNGKHLLATQLDKTTTDAGGVTKRVTDVVATDGGANDLTFIGGGMNAAWQP